MKQKLFRTKFMKSFTAWGRNIWYGWPNWDGACTYIHTYIHTYIRMYVLHTYIHKHTWRKCIHGLQVGVYYLPIPRRPSNGVTVVIGQPIPFQARKRAKSDGLVASAQRFQVLFCFNTHTVLFWHTHLELIAWGLRVSCLCLVCVLRVSWVCRPTHSLLNDTFLF